MPGIVCHMGGSIDPAASEGEIAPPRPSPFTLSLEAMDDVAVMSARIISLWKMAALAPFKIEEAQLATLKPPHTA